MKFTRILFGIGLAIAIASLFHSCLLGYDRLAYRDVSHFYFPLYEYLHARMAQGELPLWNPLDQTGIPIIGEATTATFYPGKLVFFLGLPTDIALTYYLVAHLLWGAAGAYRLSIHESHSENSALIAAFCYGLCGPLIFLYSNPPFLIGAAWLPWCFLALRSGLATEWLSKLQGRKLAWAALVLAMPILAGDPQTSLHALMLVAASEIWKAIRVTWKRRKKLKSTREEIATKEDLSPGLKVGARALLFLFACGTLAACLTSIQIVPAISWSAHSERQFQSPPGIARWLGGDIANEDREKGFFQAAHPDSHANQLYDFSIPPSQLVGLGVPNVWGRAFPQNSLTSNLFWDNARLWTPCLYVGVIPLVFALSPWFRRQVGFWQALVLIGIGCSMGKFLGLGLLELIINADMRHASPLISPAGSPYWFLVTFVPGYASFRYPAKWLSVAVLGIAMSAAHSLSTPVFSRRTEKLLFIGLGAVACVLFLSSLAPMTLVWIQEQLIQYRYDDPLYGPFQTDVALGTLQLGTLQTLLVCVIGFTFVRKGWFQVFEHATKDAKAIAKAPSSLPVSFDARMSQRHTIAVITTVLLDLVLAEQGLIATTPRALDAKLMANLSRSDTAGSLLSRSHWSIDLPTSPVSDWNTSTASERTWEIAGSQLNVGIGRWHLYRRERTLNSDVSVNNHRVATLRKAITDQVRNIETKDRTDTLSKCYAWLSVDDLMVPGKRESMPLQDYKTSVGISVPAYLRTIDPQPKLRLFDNPITVKPIKTVDSQLHWGPLLNEVIRRKSLEESSIPTVIEMHAANDESESFSVQVSRWVSNQQNQLHDSVGNFELEEIRPERIEIQVRSQRDAWMYINQYQDGNWRAELCPVDNDKEVSIVPIYRANWLGQAMPVPKGNWRIKLTYKPWWIFPSIVVTCCALTLTVGLIFSPFIKSRTADRTLRHTNF